MTTLMYPQLGTGAMSQFPIRKTRRARTVTNRAADGSTIKLADPTGAVTEWSLTYADLSDAEAATLQTFFDEAEGTLNGFTFLDPAGNLLAWSDQLDNEVWQRDPELSLTPGADDPHGGTRAWAIANSGAAGQMLAQTISSPGAYRYCLTVYLRSNAPTSARLWAGSGSMDQIVKPTWVRAVMPGPLEGDATSMRFGIEIAALGAVEAYGVQVEAQPGPSGYKATSGGGGVYENAHLRDDVLAIIKTDVNRHSCTVNIIHANHL
jgi:hypothetical protein